MSIGFLLFAALFACTQAGPWSNPHFVGDRRVITHLMQWKFEDIALECERFLGPHGYGGVQLSPVNEHAVLDRRPWYELYQPVSYKIQTRSGNETQFADMVKRCNKVDVRVYVDVVLNHMTMGESGHGTAGSTYDGVSLNYPGVPFSSLDFHGSDVCHTNDLNIHDYDNPDEARNCRLDGLRDLKQSNDWVRGHQADFLNKLIEHGVAGFRSDASKHMWPGDLEAIYGRLKPLNKDYFPEGSKPFFYHEVIYYGGKGIKSEEYVNYGRVLEFHHYRELANIVRTHNPLKYVRNWGEGWGMVASGDAVVMVDSHDLQRGHTGELGLNVNFFESRLLKVATAFMLAHPYGVPRVMSSYSWPQIIENKKDKNDWIGPPSDASGNIITVVPSPDNTCNKEWICEHRWRQIYDMVKFRNVAGDAPVENFEVYNDYQISFSRGNKAFIAINLQPGQDLHKDVQTGLPQGQYCDIVTGNLENGKCTGSIIKVDPSGYANIVVESKAEDAFIATHINAKLP